MEILSTAEAAAEGGAAATHAQWRVRGGQGRCPPAVPATALREEFAAVSEYPLLFLPRAAYPPRACADVLLMNSLIVLGMMEAGVQKHWALERFEAYSAEGNNPLAYPGWSTGTWSGMFFW